MVFDFVVAWREDGDVGCSKRGKKYGLQRIPVSGLQSARKTVYLHQVLRTLPSRLRRPPDRRRTILLRRLPRGLRLQDAGPGLRRQGRNGPKPGWETVIPSTRRFPILSARLQFPGWACTIKIHAFGPPIAGLENRGSEHFISPVCRPASRIAAIPEGLA